MIESTVRLTFAVRKCVGQVFEFCAVGFVLLFSHESVRAVQFGVSAAVQKAPPQITLSWDAAPWGGASYTVYRSTAIGGYAGGDGNWTPLASGLTGNSFADLNVVVGTEYEYRVERTGSSFNGNAYLATGIEVPLDDARGKLVLVVDASYTNNLASEINQLVGDLIGDGWTVIRQDVPRASTPAAVRGLIQAAYLADPAEVQAVYLLGRVPVLRSGSLNPDGHGGRAMPADGFYGDVDGVWSNPSYLPSDVDLQVGRVDLYDMPSFSPLTDTDLTREYLNRAHGWKHKGWTVTARAAQMTTATGESFQRQFFGAAAPTIIPNNYYAANGYYSPEFWNEVQANDYLWFTKGTGGGAYTACSGMGSTYHYAASPGVKTVFNAEFASYFEEWDVTDNFLRAPLAAKGYALTDVWSDNPAWVFMHMAMGRNIGFSTRVSQNNNSYYNIPGYPSLPNSRRGVHMALMGDPTLRMNIVAPPANVVVTTNGTDLLLTWSASPDAALQGYAVYRAPAAGGTFKRLNTSLTTTLSYRDASAAAGNYSYMVRAVKLEVTPSGSYFNGSQGVFSSAPAGVPTGERPVLNTEIAPVAPVTFVVTYSPSNFASCSLTASDVTLNKTGSATGNVTVSGSGNTRLVTISAITGSGTLGITIPAGTARDSAGNSFPAAGPSPAFTVDSSRPTITQIRRLSSGAMHLEFLGKPGAYYLVQANSNLRTTNWITLGTRGATWEGTFQFDDPGATTNTARFYRTVNQ